MTDLASAPVLSAQVAAELRDRILAGRLEPGTRIRQEEIAESFGASRIPVREALRILVNDGLVDMVSNTGAWVASLTAEECSEHYLIRERLDPLLLRQSLPGLSDDTIAQLHDAALRMAEVADVESFLAADRAFHLLTYSGATPGTLSHMVERLWNRTQPYRRAYTLLVGADHLHATHLEHELLVNALERRDAEDAERILHGHIRRTRLELERHPEVFQR